MIVSLLIYVLEIVLTPLSSLLKMRPTLLFSVMPLDYHSIWEIL